MRFVTADDERNKLMFEWGGGCLWADSDATRERFEPGPVEHQLGLDAASLERLDALSAWHDGALNWDYPPDPGPWTPAEYRRFDEAAAAMKDRLERELGPGFRVRYDPL